MKYYWITLYADHEYAEVYGTREYAEEYATLRRIYHGGSYRLVKWEDKE